MSESKTMVKRVRITAPSRLHFGLLSLGKDADRRFGGAGVMVCDPPLQLEMWCSDEPRVEGPLRDRARRYIDLWQATTGLQLSVACKVLAAPPEHTGLGVGTQLGMAVATCLDALAGRREISVSECAASVQRGARSAVGAHGFRVGGLIVEDGKRPEDSLGRLRTCVQLPVSWRLLLLTVPGQQGLAGSAERSAFAGLPQVTAELQSRLHTLLDDQLLPAAEAGDFSLFSESVYQYGIAAGECFAAAQGGPFLSREIGDVVQYCRDFGVAGVGQSSWGPTVYCWFPSEAEARQFAHRLHQQANMDVRTLVTSVCREGAHLEYLED